MATGEEYRCAICLDAWDNVACTVPCLHRFCFTCIKQWTDLKAQCPLCKRAVRAIRHSLRGDEFQELLPLGPEPPEEPRPESPRDWSLEMVGNFYPSDWANIFLRYPYLCELLRPWLQQELGRLFRADPSQALMLEHMVLCTLPVLGLNPDSLAQTLQAYLQSRTRPFVRHLIDVAVERCDREAGYLLLRGSRAADSSQQVDYSASFESREESSPVRRTTWVAIQERRQGDLVSRTTTIGTHVSGEDWLVTSTSWVGARDRRELEIEASIREAVLQRSQELSPEASSSQAVLQGSPELSPEASTIWAVLQGSQELSAVASTSWAALQGSREHSPVASTSQAALQGSQELSPEASTSQASLQGSQELSPEASTSQAASRDGTLVPEHAPALSSSVVAEDADQLAGTSSAALQGSPGCLPSIPTPSPGEQERDMEVEEAAAGASAPSQGQSCLRPQRPRKRKTGSSKDSAPPTKKPPRR